MKLLIFGSSYCKYLSRYDKIRYHKIGKNLVKFEYEYFSGKSYEYFIDDPNKIDDVLSCKPDFVLVIFGGNSISTKRPKQQLLINCRTFYQLLNAKLKAVNPCAKIIAHQLPLRFVTNGKYDTPDPETFRNLRNAVNEKVRKLPTKDYILLTASKNKLDNPNLYCDRVHFNEDGLKIQLNCIIAKLKFILEDKN